MTKIQIVRLVSRALALNLLLWTLESLTYVPMTSFSLSHYARIASRTPSEQYFLRYYGILLATRLLVSVSLFLVAVWMYRAGPTIEAFLSPSNDE